MTEKPEAPSQIDDENAKWWQAEIDAAKKRRKKWFDQAEKAVNRYRDCNDRSFGSMNILWANVETQKAALGDDFGKPDVTRANVPDDGGLTRHISLLWQRSIDAAVKDDGDNHEIRTAVHDVLLPGLGQVWLELNPQMDGEGNIAWVEAPLVRVTHTDYLEGPASSWKAVPWVARGHLFTLDDLKVMLEDTDIDPNAIERTHSLPAPEGVDSKSWQRETEGKEQFQRTRVWEIWAKFPNKRRIYIAEGFDRALKVDEDPYRLRGFFPCPRAILANGDESWQQPLTDFSRYEDQAAELDRVSQRIFVHTELLKHRGVYDTAFPELKNLATAADNILLPIENFAALMQKGGLQAAVQWEDLQPTIAILTQLHQQRQELIKLIYELTGISDIARGMSNPNETLGAQKMKMAFGSGRFQDRQKEARRFAADAYALKGELMAEHFPREQLSDMSGMPLPLGADIEAAQNALRQLQMAMQAAMQQGAPTPVDQKAVQEQQRIAAVRYSWEDISAVLRSDRRRCYRVGMETDQTRFLDEEADKKSRLEFLSAFMGVLQQLAPMIQGNPANGEVMKELGMFVLKSFRAGRAVEEGIEQALDNAIKRAQQQAQQPQPNLSPVDQAKIKLTEAQTQNLTQKLPPRESSDAELDCGQRDKGGKGLSEVFIILGKPAVPSEPREGALHDPAPG